MIGLQISQKGKIEKVNKMELCEDANSSKVKITKVLLTPEDTRTLLGDDGALYPVIPGRIAIGQISDASDFAYFINRLQILYSLSAASIISRLYTLFCNR